MDLSGRAAGEEPAGRAADESILAGGFHGQAPQMTQEGLWVGGGLAPSAAGDAGSFIVREMRGGSHHLFHRNSRRHKVGHVEVVVVFQERDLGAIQLFGGHRGHALGDGRAKEGGDFLHRSA